VDAIAVKIRFLGGTGEVGRSAVLVEADTARILLDYGVMLNHEPGFPMHVPPRDLDAVILTHCHLDHSGAIPIFHIRGQTPVYGTKLTFELTHLLLADFIHLSGYYLPYEYIEVEAMMRSAVHLGFGESFHLKNLSCTLLDAGHVPGSAQVLLEADGKRLLYTGDFNTVETRLLKGAETEYGELDAVIIESTYADEDHPDRRELEQRFVERVREVVEGGGIVLVPAFSVGRSQEIACILTAYHFEYPVFMDGMARRVNQILMDHLEYLRDPKLFMNAVHTVTWVNGRRDRKRLMRNPGVIISPAGMLKGGPSVYYLQRLAKDRKNAIFLVSYQIPGTPGHELLERGRCVIDGKIRKVKSEVEHFDFSSHCGASQLHETIKNLEGNPTIFVVHGAEGNCERLASWVREEVGLEAIAPKAGESFTI